MRSRGRIAFVTGSAGLVLAALAWSCGIGVSGSGPVFDAGTDAAAPPDAFLPPVGDGSIGDASVLDGSTLSCPTKGGAMVPSSLDGGSFCIDATEVTNAAYDAFLATSDGGYDAGALAADAAVPSRCAAASTTIRYPSQDAGSAQQPTALVDWCDAWLYCRWTGKRLCGKGATDRDASTGEWYAACSGDGSRSYPYGAAFIPDTCVDSTSSTTAAVGSHPACVGSAPSLEDMSGNVAEWVDSCSGTSCATAGGGYGAGGSADFACAASKDILSNSQLGTVGFRCCADRVGVP